MTDCVTIKLKPYLQDFVRGFLNDDVVKASTRNFIGKMLRIFIQYYPKDYKPVFAKSVYHITIELHFFTNTVDLRGNVYMSEENQRSFESMLDDFFKNLFYQYMDDKIRYNDEIKKCIIDFCDFYNITYSVINYEMLKKSYYRHRDKTGGKISKKGRKKSNSLSLNCPLFFLL
jgi:hypothetical protein